MTLPTSFHSTAPGLAHSAATGARPDTPVFSATKGNHSLRSPKTWACPVGRGTVAMRWVLALLVAVAGWFGVGMLPAAAHAELLDTVPVRGEVLTSAPEQVELRFNENVTTVRGAFQLFAPDSAALALDATASDGVVTVELPAQLADGTHSVAYRVVSADGHPVGGVLTFHIGEATSTSITPEPVARNATEALFNGLTIALYIGLLFLAGIVFFHSFVLPADAPTMVHRSLRRICLAMLLLAGVAATTLVPVAALRVLGKSPVAILQPGTWFDGVTWAPVQVAAVVLLAGVPAHLLSRRGAKRWAAAVAAVAVVAPVLTGHTRTMEPTGLMILADAGHLLAAAFWAGGLVGMLLLIPTLGAGTELGADCCAPPNAPGTEGALVPLDRAAALADVVVRFSRWALVSVVVLAVSGITMGVLVTGSVEKLITTAYGRMLLVKLGIVVAVVALAAWNRFALVPQLRTRLGEVSRWQWLNRVLRYEAALLVAVMAVTGFLANSSPNHDHSQHGPAMVRAESQGLVVVGVVEPGTVGPNAFRLQITHDGAPLVDAEVTISARHPEQGIGPIETHAVLGAAGFHHAELSLPAAGAWQVQVSARVSRFEQPIAFFDLEVR